VSPEFKVVYTKHASDMLTERNISEEWVQQTVSAPDLKNTGNDDNIHYYKSIPEHEGRVLHVVVNSHLSPEKVVTLFFDRRMGRKK